MSEERASADLRQRISGLPLWVRLVTLAILTGVAVLLSKWLVLVLLVALGLWPITVLLGLAALAIYSIGRGGFRWMRAWLGARARDLAIPLLSIFTALLIGALVIIFTDQAVYSALRARQFVEAAQLGLSNLAAE